MKGLKLIYGAQIKKTHKRSKGKKSIENNKKTCHLIALIKDKSQFFLIKLFWKWLFIKDWWNNPQADLYIRMSDLLLLPDSRRMVGLEPESGDDNYWRNNETSLKNSVSFRWIIYFFRSTSSHLGRGSQTFLACDL